MKNTVITSIVWFDATALIHVKMPAYLPTTGFVPRVLISPPPKSVLEAKGICEIHLENCGHGL